jgi:hypothetical protein
VPVQLAASAAALIGDPERTRGVAAAARLRVDTHFRLEPMARALEDAYLEVLERPRVDGAAPATFAAGVN